MAELMSRLEDQTLAVEFSKPFGQLVQAYHEHYQLAPADAVQRAQEPPSPEALERTRTAPPQELSWDGLGQLAQTDPELARERWGETLDAALAELRSGHRAAVAVSGATDGPWERARFLALRHELLDQWKPRNGVERVLIDTLAQAQTMYLFWLEILATRTRYEADKENKQVGKTGRWSPPCVQDVEAEEQAMGMVDRFNRIAVRTLRALRDLRRYVGPVVVQGGQVNIAEQQVNVAG